MTPARAADGGPGRLFEGKSMARRQYMRLRVLGSARKLTQGATGELVELLALFRWEIQH